VEQGIFVCFTSRGAFSCSFSNSGLYIAIACVGPNTYPIKVYDTFNGERIATLEGHQDLVYQMSWSLDDR
jgi:WD40 repeat protein